MVFTATAFFGAALLFTIQPLVARLLLPAYGGSATVWSTCSLFFQVLLILGYVYSHVVTTRLPRRLQPRVHLLALAVPLLALPLALPTDAAPAADQSPALWLLRTLVLMVGLPFVVLATSGPLLQRWYSWSGGPRREDPYFLFAASNVGSFGGLLAYPFLIEPHLSLRAQTSGFSLAFLGFAVLAATCGFLSLHGPPTAASADRASRGALPRRRVALWVAYAFLPSCLMLAVTRHLSTDVAPIPLLWVAPLALYLATFVGAFAVRSRERPTLSPRAAAALGFAGILVSPLSSALPLPLTLTFNLLLVGTVGYAAHRMLAADRPEPRHLTSFYLAVAVGGALGGLVNGLLAPVALNSVLEYPLTLALLPLLCLLPRGLRARGGRIAVLRRRSVLAVLLLALGIAVVARLVPGDSGVVTAYLAIAAFALLGYVLSRFPAAASGGLVVLVVAGALFGNSDIAQRERTFYGTYEVKTAGSSLTSLSHGTTLHGLQSRTPTEEREPTTYYARSGPLGDIMDVVRPHDVVAVGLGIGTLVAYGAAGDAYTFLEIDRAVVDIAEDERYFSYLSGADADVQVRVGDGRLLATDLPAGGSDAVILDAFSSDAIPVHLLSHEAFDVYAERLRPGGAIAVHISNRHFDLVPVLAATADHLGWRGVVGNHPGGGDDLSTPSTWVLLTADPEVSDALSDRSGWRSLDASRRVVWTDDYSSVLTVLK